MRYLIMLNFRISARKVVISVLKIKYLDRTRLVRDPIVKEFYNFPWHTVALRFVLSRGFSRYLIKFKTRHYNSLCFFPMSRQCPQRAIFFLS